MSLPASSVAHQAKHQCKVIKVQDAGSESDKLSILLLESVAFDAAKTPPNGHPAL